MRGAIVKRRGRGKNDDETSERATIPDASARPYGGCRRTMTAPMAEPPNAASDPTARDPARYAATYETYDPANAPPSEVLPTEKPPPTPTKLQHARTSNASILSDVGGGSGGGGIGWEPLPLHESSAPALALVKPRELAPAAAAAVLQRADKKAPVFVECVRKFLRAHTSTMVVAQRKRIEAAALGAGAYTRCHFSST